MPAVRKLRKWRVSRPSHEVSLGAEHKIIPVLANGKAASNAFGAVGQEVEWEAGAKIPLEIEYFSFEGKRYTEEMDLWLVDDAGFAQTSWGIPTPRRPIEENR